MPKAKRFRSVGGGHVSVFVPWRPDPLEIPEGGTYETDDKRELDVLQASSEVVEVKGKK
jgi:hypothetical protein